MPNTTREIIKGLASGAAFLLFAFALGTPLWLAAGVSAGCYVGLSFLLPKPPAPGTDAAALGLSARERDEFLASCRKSAANLARLASQIPNRTFAGRVTDLGRTALNLAAYLEKKPDAILLSYSVPRNLEHLVGMLGQYVAICGYQQAGQTAEEALRKVENIFDTACDSFAGMYRQLLNNDIAALESSAHTLAILMGVDADLEKQRPSQSEPINPQPVPHRLPQKGKSL
jgi:hypothetical protein